MARSNTLLLATALVLPWLFIWQGVDVTDQGYLFTIYRCFLRHPEAVAHTSHMWLTNTIGGVWDLLFGRFGAVSLRALWALCTSLGVFLSFRAVRRCCGERAAVLGVLVVSMFLAGRRETWFSYNTSTALLSAAAAATLFQALCKRDLRGLLLAGFFLGLSPFARLSNVLHAAMLTAVLFAALLDRSRVRALPRELGAGIAGYLLGVAMALVSMRALGHWAYFWQAAYDLLHPTSPSVSHGIGSLIRQLVHETLLAVPAGLSVLGFGAAVFKLAPRLPKPLALGLYALLVGVGIYALTYFGHHTTVEPWTWFVIGPCYVVLASVALGLLGQSFEVRLACFIGLVALFVTPIGSDNGIRAWFLGVTFALPLTLAVLFSAGTEARAPLRALAIVAGLTVMGESIDRALVYSYRDRPRSELWTPVGHPQLYAQLTTPARAKVLREVLSALEQRVGRGDYLLAYDGTPLLQYLTFTRPYTGRPWMMTDDDPAAVPGMLRTALGTSKCLPVAVRSLGSARSNDWPAKRRKPERKQAGTRKAITRFLKQHDYRPTWQNAYFEILEPPDGAGPGHPCR
jgi:hypothetical protein